MSSPQPPVPTPHGTRRRLQALASRGWSPQALQAATGLPVADISAITSGRRPASPELGQSVAAAYNQLWDQPPPAATPRDQHLATAARTNAHRQGWPPPLGWDDDEIDLPRARPAPGWKPGPATSRRAVDLAEDMAFVQEHGGYRHASMGAIADRLGVTRDVLQQASLRAARYHARAADPQAEAG